ncbi:hypothetical protein C8Q80DRAFT_772779 [Daedaleopsis nitida]|nr:hypothetical protein C8Q80DRAFT_772779 [Daedaleopsis nitida]
MIRLTTGVSVIVRLSPSRSPTISTIGSYRHPEAELRYPQRLAQVRLRTPVLRSEPTRILSSTWRSAATAVVSALCVRPLHDRCTSRRSRCTGAGCRCTGALLRCTGAGCRCTGA